MRLARLAGPIALHLLAVSLAGAAAGNAIESTEPASQAGSAFAGAIGLIEPAPWLAVPTSSKLRELRQADFRPPPIEFPSEAFSFSLVEYSTPIRVVDIDMMFHLEAPGTGRSLVSCEFIF